MSEIFPVALSLRFTVGFALALFSDRSLSRSVSAGLVALSLTLMVGFTVCLPVSASFALASCAFLSASLLSP